MHNIRTYSASTWQVLGGYGYCDEYQVERLWRDAKLLEIGGGTIEAHHKNMVSAWLPSGIYTSCDLPFRETRQATRRDARSR